LSQCRHLSTLAQIKVQDCGHTLACTHARMGCGTVTVTCFVGVPLVSRW
jgi:3-keto-L-gulonate-6-phosphate decarboxylase